MGALFFTVVVVVMFTGLSQMSMTTAQVPVFSKQRDFLCHPSWVYALPLRMLKITFTLVEVGAWVILAYYVNGFDPMLEGNKLNALNLSCFMRFDWNLFFLFFKIYANVVPAAGCLRSTFF